MYRFLEKTRAGLGSAGVVAVLFEGIGLWLQTTETPALGHFLSNYATIAGLSSAAFCFAFYIVDTDAERRTTRAGNAGQASRP